MGGRMSRVEFRRWLETEADGKRYELVAGEPVALSPEKVGHALVKAQLWRLLDAAIRAKGIGCQVLPDGITVEIDEDTDYEPDVVVNCGPTLPLEAVAAPNPAVIVEVLSRSSKGLDGGEKFMDYFRLPGLRHYLLVSYNRRTVVHHRRQDDGTILSRILTGGMLHLDPPGVDLDIDAVYAAAGVP